ncbi:DUF6350 family protein [uncultured Microbacterium sp.]|uniref:cell division protein PerM n=1 Tax=uncultured Microbacterium sp. TaxID=191216 RepID=UPI0035CA9BEF
MNRVLVAFLAAFDAALAVAVGLAVVLAPLTVLWVIGLGQADWSALWPASATIWQFGNLVPVLITLPPDYLAVTGIDPAAASFWISLAPLGFAAFTAIFAARSGARASRADAWLTGVVAGGLVFGALAALVALSARTSIAAIHLWQAVLFPTLVFVVAALIGALVVEWREASAGPVAHLRDRIEARADGWGDVPGLTVRGATAVLVGLIGAGALVVAVSLMLRGGEVIALFESGNMEALGATMTTLAQLAYLPTVVVWGLSFVAGPGFSLGVGTSVSPAGTQLGVVPGIPLLGAIPDTVSSWLLLLALIPVALGAFAGWIVRSRLVRPGLVRAGERGTADRGAAERAEPITVRLTLAVAIAALSAAGAALLSVLASGALGPGRLAEVGPQPGPVALAVGLEVLLGAGILLLSPRPHRPAPRPLQAQQPVSEPAPALTADMAQDAQTAPIERGTQGRRPVVRSVCRR